MDKLEITKRDFKESLENLLKNDIEGMPFDKKISYVRGIVFNFEKENENYRDTSNKGKSWKDEEIEIILSDAPTKENCLKYAKIFKRGYGSIEQIYRWASTPINKMNKERKEDSFIMQIKKVAKDIGYRG